MGATGGTAAGVRQFECLLMVQRQADLSCGCLHVSVQTLVEDAGVALAAVTAARGEPWNVDAHHTVLAPDDSELRWRSVPIGCYKGACRC